MLPTPTKEEVSRDRLRQALLIREVEQRFLSLFSEGKVNGTVHTCVGQEFSAVAVAGQLEAADFVFSNHRCHGHFIAFTGRTEPLIAELLGKETGTCGGIGSSQHLCSGNFHSNGVQGGILPVAAGMALKLKLENSPSIGAVFIGDGTLGEGVTYETLNLVSLLDIPLLIVCEDNGYAQSTPRPSNLAGEILSRAEAFAIRTFSGSTDDPAHLISVAGQAIEHVRLERTPAFLLVDTVRLNSHSKGDDTRSREVLESLRKRDYLERLEQVEPDLVSELRSEVQSEVTSLVDRCEQAGTLSADDYYRPSSNQPEPSWQPALAFGERLAKRINRFFTEKMAGDPRIMMLGEDILSPYGGAFKITAGLSEQFPDRVISTPISEAGITGLGNGLALAGMKPFVEIMFGDFITLAMDQIVNHASKFHHMYNRQTHCPVVIRTPMGGRRGYGPTHSQTLDKLVCGIDNVQVVALNPFVDPYPVLESLCGEQHPAILIENKADYARLVGPPSVPGYRTEVSGERYPTVRIRPVRTQADVTVVTYGGMSTVVCDSLADLFANAELLAEVFVLGRISPFDPGILLHSLRQTRRLVVAEEGSCAGGFGSEVVSSTMEAAGFAFASLRIGAKPVPIPSPPSMENGILPGPDHIRERITQFCRLSHD